MPTTVSFGNPSPQHQVEQDDGSLISTPHPFLKQSVTTAEMWEGFDDADLNELTLSTNNDRVLSAFARGLAPEDRKYAIGIAELDQVAAAHAAGDAPTWVTSSDPEFARVLGEHFGCMVGEPTLLQVTVGRDAMHAQHLSTTQPAPFNYMALTATSTPAPAVGDTTLAGEITTAGGGLIRALGTYAHTAGTNTSTLTKTFTANGSDVLPVTVAQDGVFNAVTAGTMGYHDALSSSATLSTSGDNVTLTITFTIG